MLLRAILYAAGNVQWKKQRPKGVIQSRVLGSYGHRISDKSTPFMYIFRYKNFYVAKPNECASFCAAFAQPPQNKNDGGTPDSGLHGMFHGLTPAAWVLFQIAFIHLEREYEKQKDSVSVPLSIQAPRSRLLR